LIIQRSKAFQDFTLCKNDNLAGGPRQNIAAMQEKSVSGVNLRRGGLACGHPERKGSLAIQQERQPAVKLMIFAKKT
jgi:hypothetical protein